MPKNERTGKPLTLADVDGTIPGKASLIIIDLDDTLNETGQGIMRSDFTEGEYDCTNPVDSCHRLWRGTKDDWPDHVSTIVASPRATYLTWAQNMRSILGITVSAEPEDYLRDDSVFLNIH